MINLSDIKSKGWEYGINKVINADCLELMKEIPDNSIDLIVTSPPYNMRTRIRNGKYTERERGEHFSKKYTFFSDDMTIEGYYDFHSKAIKEMLRVSFIVFWNIQIVTGSKEAIFNIIGNCAKNIKDIIVWDKGFGQPAMNPKVLNRATEYIIIFERDGQGRTFKKSYFDRGTMQDIWRIKRAKSLPEHGACFPLELVAKIINNWTVCSDLIFDPFMGSGTTARACIDLNRRFYGAEISKEYCSIWEDRIKQQVLI